MEFIKKEYKSLLVIFILFLINVFLFKNKMIALYIDFGKEIYFAKSIAQGGVLYKDVLALFGPFAYLLNALFVKFLGAYIRTFYFVGAINALMLLNGIYMLSREFLSRVNSLVITIFVLYFCCFAAHVMNYLTPYSYAVVYGLCAVVYSVLMFVKYLKQSDSIFLYSSMFFAGLASACKYEFVLLIAVMIVFLFVKRTSLRCIINSICFYMTVPLACLGILFIQGLGIKELVDFFSIWLKFVVSSDMKSYYTGYCYFSSTYFVFALKSFVIVLLALTMLYFLIKFVETLSKKVNSKYFSLKIYSIFLLALTIMCSKFDMLIINFTFCSCAMVLAVLSFIKIKELLKNLPVLFLVAASLVISLKVFFFISIIQYGRYFLPLILLAMAVILQEYYFNGTKKQKKLFDKTLVVFLLFISILSISSNLKTLKMLDTKISTSYGTVYKDKVSAKVFNTILETINKNSTVEDTVVVLQEGLLINFLSGRNADKYNYLIPSLLNIYGENKVLNHYIKVKPEIFVILTSPNDSDLICNGWGYGICGYISQNYRMIQQIRADKLILIFKKI